MQGAGEGGPLPVRNHFCWGGGGGRQQKVCSLCFLFLEPNREPVHGLHPCFVVAEIWADRVGGGGQQV